MIKSDSFVKTCGWEGKASEFFGTIFA